jgi:hypothetical protein
VDGADAADPAEAAHPAEAADPVERPTRVTGAPTGSGWDEDGVALVEARARELESDVCGAAGVAPSAVRRLRWSRRALREAGA